MRPPGRRCPAASTALISAMSLAPAVRRNDRRIGDDPQGRRHDDPAGARPADARGQSSAASNRCTRTVANNCAVDGHSEPRRIHRDHNLGHRFRDGPDRRLDDHHHVGRHRTIAERDGAGPPGARTGNPGLQSVWRCQRRIVHCGHSRLWRNGSCRTTTLLLFNGRRLMTSISATSISAPSRATDRADRDHLNPAVCSGDGAVGGIINFITKSGLTCRRR